jgi:hypothetical protein
MDEGAAGSHRFDEYVSKLPALHAELMAAPLVALKVHRDWNKLKAIYVFYEGGAPCHVGRTRNLAQRVKGHLASSHYSASFAFARARRKLELKPSYRKGEGRAALMENPEFRGEFERQRGMIGAMELRFIKVEDAVMQYLLELYCALQLGTSLDEFETS